MALTVATNTGALMAQAAASSVNKDMEISMERLSTGKRINGASDDAAGVAIASRLTSEIRGTNQAIRNAMDGQAMMDTAEGAHSEVEIILQRMRELAVQAANDTNNSTDRTNIQTEITSLVAEIDRISSVTTWAGQKLLDATGGSSGTFSFQIGSGTASADTVDVSISSIAASSLAVSGNAALADFFSTASGSSSGASAYAGSASSSGYAFALNGSVMQLEIGNASAAIKFSVGETGNTITIAATTSASSGSGYNASSGGELDANIAATNIAETLNADTKFAGFTAVATTDGSGKINIYKGAIDVTTTSAAQASVNLIDSAITTVNTQRANLGSISNRLDSTVSNLTNISSNLQAGRGRIEDADFAAETTNLAKSQILQQASTAMLAQANASKQNVLSLLQG
jgi:flagellin